MESSHRPWPATARAATLAVAFLLAFGAGSAHALVVPTVVGTSQADAIFAEPLPGEADNNIHNHLLTLINNTPPGQKIRAAIHSLGNYEIADALVKRAQAGVSVEIVYPQNKRDGTNAYAVNRLDDIGTNKANQSWVHWCNHNGSGVYGDGCISTATGLTPEAGGTMHSKFFLFSATGQGGLRKWVTWFGSANLTSATGTETWNDGLTVYDNQALYNAFEQKLFVPMYNQTSFTNNNFGGLGGYFSVPSAGLEVHASPYQGSDLVVNQTYGMSGPACSVLVATNTFTRTDVAYRLADMKAAGCQVFVLVGMNDPAPTLTDPAQCAGKANLGDNMNVFNILNNAKIPIRKKKIHDKLVLLAAPGMTSTVLTGSHNLTWAAQHANDEILVEVASAAAYDAFSAHWWQAWTEGGCNVQSYY